MGIPLLLAINIGTGFMFALVAVTIIIRQRHFNSHGYDAMLVPVMFILLTAILRWVAVNYSGFLPIDTQRFLNGYVALMCLSWQLAVLVQAEMELRARKLVEHGYDLLELV